MKLENKVALITGAGRGIGRAIALAFAREGATVILCARTREEIELVAAEINAAGGAADAIPADVTLAKSVEALSETARERHDHIDILVNNAGIASSSPLIKYDEELWNATMETNATGAFRCIKAFLPGMIARKWGRIVNNASIAGKMGMAYTTAYTAAKHALVGLTKSLALEVADWGITVNALCPGFVRTDMGERAAQNISQKTGMPVESAYKVLANLNARKRWIEPEEVASVAVYLASEEARYVTGQTIDLW